MWHKVLLLLAIVINILLLGRLFLSDEGMEGYNKLKAETATLEAEMQKVEQKNLVLSREIELLNSDTQYIEKVIRDKLNFVKDNEILYLFQETQPHYTPGATSDDGEN